MDVAEARRAPGDDELAKGSGTTGVVPEFGLLTADVGGAFIALPVRRRGTPGGWLSRAGGGS